MKNQMEKTTNQIEGLKINESKYKLKNGCYGTLAVFLYNGGADPRKVLEYAVKEYVGDNSYHELMCTSVSNPWMRVVVSNINDMKQEPFDILKHKLKSPKGTASACKQKTNE